MNVTDLSVLSHHNEVLSTELTLSHAQVCEFVVWIHASEAEHWASDVMVHPLAEALHDLSKPHLHL